MHIKRSIRFILHVRKKNADTTKPVAVRLRVAYNGHTIDFSTGCKVAPCFWDSDSGMPTGGTDFESNVRSLKSLMSLMDETFARYELIEKKIPTPDEVKQLFNDLNGKPSVNLPSSEKPFFAMFDKFLGESSKANSWADSTGQTFTTTRNMVERWKPDLRFSDITDETFQSFVVWMVERGLKNRTIKGHIDFLKWFLRWAQKRGYYLGDANHSFKTRLKGTTPDSKEVIYLTTDEIRKLESFVPDGSKHQEILAQNRDCLLFSCFTGLRYSDIKKLTKTDVRNGYIAVVTQKTTNGIHIELNKHSRAILEKYKDYGFPNDKALPVPSIAIYNQHIKDVARICGIDAPTRIVYFIGNKRMEEVHPKWELLSSHCGRRSFVVNALRLGIPAEVIIRWTGHSDFATLKPYFKIVDELKAEQMAKFDDFGNTDSKIPNPDSPDEKDAPK